MNWLMNYNWKWVEELLWAVVTAVGFTFAQVILTTDFDTITDWRTWAVSLGGAMIRGALVGLATAIRSLIGARANPRKRSPKNVA